MCKNEVDNKRWELLPACDVMWHGQVDSKASTPYSDDVAYSKQYHSQGIQPLGALRTIAKRAHQNKEEEGDVELQEDFKYILARAFAQEIECVGFAVDSSGGGHKEEERKIEVSKRCPRKQ